MIPVAGQQVGPYEILGRLGSGGMGIVFSAWDSRLHRDVAIKLLREDYTRADDRERFLMEARAASGLNHPNICTIFDMGEQEGNPYMVMELLRGQTLRSCIQSGPMSTEEILHTGIEIADALVSAHTRGIIHRDIKPANIFLVDKPYGGWQVKVLDFGLAKIDLGDGVDPLLEMTAHGTTVGTVAYMSPEQARGEILDARSDLFAVGIVLYEMATGVVPFQGKTSATIFVQLLNDPPAPVRDVNPGVPIEFERTILKLLAKDRAERFQSSAELLEELHRIVLPNQPAAQHRRFGSPPPSTIGEATSSAVLRAFALDEKVRTSDSSSGGVRRSSRETSIIRPVRREPLPPSEFPATPTHWTRPSQLGGVAAAGDSSSMEAPAVQGLSSAEISAAKARVVEEPPAIFSYTEPEDEVAAASPPIEESTTPRWLPWAIAGAIVPLLAGVLMWRMGASTPIGAGSAKLMLASVANHSGDNALDGVVLEGLRLDLAQSPHLALTGSPSEATGLRSADPVTLADARKIAAAAGASSFLFGDVGRRGGAYVVSADVYDVASGKTMLRAEQASGSRERIADAIDRLAAQIRLGLGEKSETFARTSLPLARDATANVEALRAYVAGLGAATGGRPMDALPALQHATELDPKFTQAWVRLADLYREAGAEVAAADASRHARDASAGAGERTRLLAEASYDLNATGDYPQALKVLEQVGASYPLDASIGARRALLLRLEGKFSDAIIVAQNALARNPYDRQASGQAENAMLALDRGDAAADMDAQAGRRGQRHPAIAVLLPFLNDAGANQPAPLALQNGDVDQYRAQFYRAQLLDATGQMTAGFNLWLATANTARITPALVSTAAYAVAQAALNRALTSDCETATALAREASSLPRGRSAIFAIGMARGLCGDGAGARDAVDTLTLAYPQSFAVKNYYLAELMAVDQIHSGDTGAALVTLQPAKPFDLISLTPYERGLTRAAAGQWPLAIADFQFVLLHRGAVTLTDAPMYPMAQLGLARAYAASGDKVNSAAAYRTFLEMWKAADANDPLVVEARKHVR